jgi:hypothetical protein
MEREDSGEAGRQPYEGGEAMAPEEDFSHIDPDELTGPGGRLPAVDGVTAADDAPDTETS